MSAGVAPNQRHVALVASTLVAPKRGLDATVLSPVEMMWLPIIGPSAMTVWRYLYVQAHLMKRPAVMLWEIVLDCGLTDIKAARTAIQRLVSFGVVKEAAFGRDDSTKIIVTSWLERPSQRRQDRLEERREQLQSDHQDWVNRKGRYT